MNAMKIWVNSLNIIQTHFHRKIGGTCFQGPFYKGQQILRTFLYKSHEAADEMGR